jgi:hypothetical protein
LKSRLAALAPHTAFLGRVGEGKSVSTFYRNETVFAQGDAADSIFYCPSRASMSPHAKLLDAFGSAIEVVRLVNLYASYAFRKTFGLM